MPKISNDVKAMIDNALADEAPCLVGTVSAEGRPEISPKGSVLVLDEQTLAYWERSKRSALKNVRANPNVVVYYRNPARAEKLPRGAALRFYGAAEVHTDGEVRDRVMAKVVEPELKADPDRIGVAVVVKLDRITDLRGEDQ